MVDKERMLPNVRKTLDSIARDFENIIRVLLLGNQMSSILTNNSATVALETLRNINRNLQGIQSEISTGKKVSTAKDNAAIFAVSTVIDSDAQSFKGISDSLNFGSSSVGVARAASEQIVEEIQEIKNLIVSAQNDNVDASKIQTDIDERVKQIGTIVDSAQFNGLNLINGASSADVNFLASLNRAADGTVSKSNITVERANLSTAGVSSSAVYGGSAVTNETLISNEGTNAGSARTVGTGTDAVIGIEAVADGNGYRITIDDTGAADSLGSRTFEYVAGTDDSAVSVAAALATQISTFLSSTGQTDYVVARDGAEITLTNNSGGNALVTTASSTGGTAAVGGGGLTGLAGLDVTTATGKTSALTAVEGLLSTAIDAASNFGSSQTRIETQGEFVQTLTDSLTAGVGALVDSDIEAASARLQALQVQQQLGTQALAIANQGPQNLLALFR